MRVDTPLSTHRGNYEVINPYRQIEDGTVDSKKYREAPDPSTGEKKPRR